MLSRLQGEPCCGYRHFRCAICASMIFKTLYARHAGRGTRLSRLIRRERKSVYRLRLWDRLHELLRDSYYPPKALQLVLPLDFLWWGVLFWLKVSPTATALQVIARLQQFRGRYRVGICPVNDLCSRTVRSAQRQRTKCGRSAPGRDVSLPDCNIILGLLGAFIFLSTPLQAQLSILVTLVCASFVLFRLCNTLLDDYYLHSAAVRLLQDKIRRSIGTTVDTRLGLSSVARRTCRHQHRVRPLMPERGLGTWLFSFPVFEKER